MKETKAKTGRRVFHVYIYIVSLCVLIRRHFQCSFRESGLEFGPGNDGNETGDESGIECCRIEAVIVRGT